MLNAISYCALGDLHNLGFSHILTDDQNYFLKPASNEKCVRF